MSALNFTKFVDKVASGEKTCTIRARRKRPIRLGEDLHLFTGMRQKNCRRLIAGPVRCEEVWDITIARAGAHATDVAATLACDDAKFVIFDLRRMLALAKFDGFPDLAEFAAFFVPRGERQRFEGQIIRWKHPDRPFVPTMEVLR